MHREEWRRHLRTLAGDAGADRGRRYASPSPPAATSASQTCRDRFDNVVNFRGFPHIPGNDFVISYPVQGEPGNDGKSWQG